MTRLPRVAIVGRPNVGKSTLFNRLVGSRRALVRDIPGLTRDRIEGRCRFDGRMVMVVDTGGLDPTAEEPLAQLVRQQVLAAIEESDAVLFVVDVREGLTPLDHEVAGILRRSARPVVVVANKADSAATDALAAEIHRLGIAPVVPVSAEHGRGMGALLEALGRLLPSGEPESSTAEEPTRVAVVGRPNVGKSSLVNAILGQERVVVHPQPGTTRDAVDVAVTIAGRPYVLVDTAGLRRKGRTTAAVDRLGAIMARKSLERAHLALVVLDASEGVTAQDAHIAGYAESAGRAVILVANKWDLVRGRDRGPALVRALRERLAFVAHAPVVFTSARDRTGLEELFEALGRVAEAYGRQVKTAELNRVLGEAMARRAPAAVRGRTLRLYYATQTGVRPPTFVLFVNDPEALHFTYERYLVKHLREAFGLAGCPIRLELRRRSPRARAAS